MTGLIFGVSGLPLGQGRRFDTASGIACLGSLGLGAMELPFVRSITVTDRNREAILASKEAAGLTLSAHGSYYVNFNAAEPEKIEQSLVRIADAARALKSVGGRSLVFHPGFYLGQPPDQAWRTIRDNLARLPELGVDYRLETTGKPTQFGTVEEIVALCRELPGCKPCIDFSHVHARGGGALKGYGDFARILECLRDGLGPGALLDMHLHVSGIAYTAKGERNHLPLAESDFPYRACLAALRDYGARGLLISEGPRVEHDALLLRETWRELGRER